MFLKFWSIYEEKVSEYGYETARSSSHLGREVRFEGVTPEAFGELITPLFGPAAAPVVELYQVLNTQDGSTIAEDGSAQELLGLRPRSIEQWLKDLAVS